MNMKYSDIIITDFSLINIKNFNEKNQKKIYKQINNKLR